VNSPRKFIGHEMVPPEPHFRWRGGEITRLESFTDAVFAFAVTLLVVSLEVPKTYGELIWAMKGFFAFAICFFMLTQVWYYHYIYSRRYGLQTKYTVVLNFILIFVVLFYVYPLKFLFALVFGGLTQGFTMPVEQLQHMFTSERQVPALMVIYSLGYIAVCVLFALLYSHAYSKRAELELNEYEALRTRFAVIYQLSFATVGVVAILCALLMPVRIAGYSGMAYSLNAVVGFGLGPFARRKEQAALKKIANPPGEVPYR
jgi:uncharacterized membrane protein